MKLKKNIECVYNYSKISGYGYNVEFFLYDKLLFLFYNFSISEVLKVFISEYYG